MKNIVGKDEVASSNLAISSRKARCPVRDDGFSAFCDGPLCGAAVEGRVVVTAGVLPAVVIILSVPFLQLCCSWSTRAFYLSFLEAGNG